MGVSVSVRPRLPRVGATHVGDRQPLAQLLVLSRHRLKLSDVAHPALAVGRRLQDPSACCQHSSASSD